MSKSYANFDEFISLLKARHLKFMSSRTDKKLGEFKDRVNRAGITTFVDLELVTGTLLKGFELIRQLRGLLQRLNLHGVIFATWPLILGDKPMDYTEKEENPPSFWHSYF